MKDIKIIVTADTGLHARPAAQIVEASKGFDSEISLTKNDKTVSGKSIMGILSLSVSTGDEIILSATGNDEVKAIETLSHVISNEIG